LRTQGFSAILKFVPPPSAVRDHIRILGEFVRQPVHTGTVAPSSPWLAERLVENMGLAEAETVVELGPGTGPFTRLIAQRARPDAVVLALELNPRLAAELVGQFAQIEIVNDSAERLPDHLRARGRTHADCILSGLPFAAFTQDLQRRLLDAILESLPTGGRFATFAYVHAAWLPPGQRFRRLLQSRFSRVTRSSIVWRNLPPAFVYRCEK
jgi:phosphatidylethanolamine/phosphatidyl-N-methylethanolamine N-methyltransferase